MEIPNVLDVIKPKKEEEKFYADTTVSQVTVNNEPLTTGGKIAGITIFILVLVWIVAGLAGFITSLVCFGKSGTIAEKIIGVLLAVFFGPFYWLYFIFAKSYCSSAPQVVYMAQPQPMMQPQVAAPQAMGGRRKMGRGRGRK